MISNRTALVLLDLQPVFMTSARPAASDVVSAANTVLGTATALDLPVIAIRTEHSPDGATWTLNMRRAASGFAYSADPATWFHPDLQLPVGTTCLTKTRDSGFYLTGLDDLLGYLQINSILLAGTSAELSIEHTARDAYARNVRVTFIQDAISSQSIRTRNEVLRRMSDQFGQQSVHSSQIMQRLRGLDVPQLIGR
ncbi:MAG TPA: cysteine hydrolase [Actinomycetes bacterium]|nr:cysteine hydrolase [Actinomycetes bacterium]